MFSFSPSSLASTLLLFLSLFALPGFSFFGSPSDSTGSCLRAWHQGVDGFHFRESGWLSLVGASSSANNVSSENLQENTAREPHRIIFWSFFGLSALLFSKKSGTANTHTHTHTHTPKGVRQRAPYLVSPPKLAFSFALSELTCIG